MRNKICRLLVLLCCLLPASALFAQTNGTLEDTMRSHDKIYVVMAVCVTILAGLLLYLVSIDRKIGKIENKQ